MTLTERYLHAVRSFLPAAQQADITRELADDIRAQLGDREEELGRPLTAEDEAAVLRRFGHPLLLAAKYRRQQHVISPTLFPFYVFALKISLGVALAVHVALAIAVLATGRPPGEAIAPLASFPFGPAIMVFGWVTLVFALIDLNVDRFAGVDRWNPSSLPEPRPESPQHSRLALLFEIIASTIFLIWWLAVPTFPFLVFGPMAAVLDLGPVWRTVHLPVAGLWLVSLYALWAVLLWPDWLRYRPIVSVLTNVGAVAIGVVLLRAGTYVTLAAGADPAQHTEIAHAVNLAFRLGMVAWVCVATWEIARTLWRLGRGPGIRTFAC